MRLLKYGTNDELVLEDFYGRSLPRYAVLSHTWGDGEVSFQELASPACKVKAGYRKIQFCGTQARRNGLRYFWVDTCCIDKSSSAELTEAFNSMYNWYADAECCFVYLSDVFLDSRYDPNDQPETRLESAIRSSRWFLRGWTLQELIAPRSVVFCAADGTQIGTKESFEALISGITSIPKEVLNHSKQPTEYTVSERMVWAAHRSTTKVEDRAYCLMGLFGVNMPLLYGEGESAFQRLQKEILGLTNQTSGLRLLVVDSNPLTMETFAGSDEPSYAILSHTWGTNEVSFQDVLVGKAPERRGYQKIKNSCEQAARHGYKYLWVDTCCIDKSSSAELQEAICSMYKWYQKAGICFVYLEDFELYSAAQADLSSCRWFKRGWTLQELIAPSVIEFYDSKWNVFGTKDSLYSQLSKITGIDSWVLRGKDPTRKTVAERMSWAAGRSTTRIEDAAYSLMGLFNVFMPMLYGEGNRAFIRLQEEIMRQSEDHTIFAWKAEAQSSRDRGMFAQSPDEFGRKFLSEDEDLDDLEHISQYTFLGQELNNPAALTSRGILIRLPLLMQETLYGEGSEHDLVGDQLEVSKKSRSCGCFGRSSAAPKSLGLTVGAGTYLALICSINSNQILCISLQKRADRGIFVRILPGSVTLLPERRASEFKMSSIFVVPNIINYASSGRFKE